MEKIYKANDGKLFMSEKECVGYEKQLEDKELSRKAMHEEVEKAKSIYDLKVKEMQEAYGDYQSKLADFCKKYGYYHTKINTSDLFPFSIFEDLLKW